MEEEVDDNADDDFTAASDNEMTQLPKSKPKKKLSKKERSKRISEAMKKSADIKAAALDVEVQRLRESHSHSFRCVSNALGDQLPKDCSTRLSGKDKKEIATILSSAREKIVPEPLDGNKQRLKLSNLYITNRRSIELGTLEKVVLDAALKETICEVAVLLGHLHYAVSHMLL